MRLLTDCATITRTLGDIGWIVEGGVPSPAIQDGAGPNGRNQYAGQGIVQRALPLELATTYTWGARIQDSAATHSPAKALWEVRVIVPGISIDTDVQVFTVLVNAGGFLELWVSGVIVGSGSIEIPPQSYAYVETQVLFSDTGYVEVRLDGVPEITWAMDTLVPNSIPFPRVRFFFGTSSGSTNWRFLDIYILDDRPGESGKFTTFLGDTEIYFCPIVGNGASSDFTPSAGANWENIDEKVDAPFTAVPDEAATVNSSATPGDRDTFLLDTSALPTDGSRVIAGVVERVRTSKDASGDRTYRGVMTSQGQTRLGTARMPPTTHVSAGTVAWGRTDEEAAELSPTGADWEVTELSTAEFGYEVVT